MKARESLDKEVIPSGASCFNRLRYEMVVPYGLRLWPSLNRHYALVLSPLEDWPLIRAISTPADFGSLRL